MNSFSTVIGFETMLIVVYQTPGNCFKQKKKKKSPENCSSSLKNKILKTLTVTS